jgi:catechol 2,3-dioxygenase-like lactoylglutathione lyase family enzyme
LEQVLDGLVSRYEQGRCSRRELLATLGALVAMVPLHSAAALPASPFRCRELNHVTLRVKDLGRSKQFYSKLLGLPLLSEDKDSCRLSLGRGFVSLWLDSASGFDHWCVGVDAFTQARAGAQDHTRDSVRDSLQREGFSLRRDEGDSTIYVRDPDGNVVQLEARGFKA